MTEKRIQSKQWFGLALCLCLPILLDQWTKNLASSPSQAQLISQFGIPVTSVLKNYGVAGGSLFDLPPMFRSIALSTLGGFLILAYVLIQFLLPIRALALRAALSVLLSAFLSNVGDRIIHGYVIDFIPVRLAGSAYAVNFADLIQLPTLLVVVLLVLRDHSRLWPEKNLRKLNVIEPAFQKRYGRVVASCCLASALAGGIYAYSFIRSSLELSLNTDPALASRILSSFIVWFGVVQLAVLLASFVLARLMSHRAAGPVFALTRFLRATIEGKNPETLKFRKNDDFRVLETLGHDVAQEISELRARLDQKR